ncbi:MAG: DNA replication and repair protein RecF [Candidatus Gracilibacteria bacterium]|jgi:DNA replication and repair protein RecF|nr:DNA replication and repair protein RecF [Candidatus Gracilibacteria bacterium]
MQVNSLILENFRSYEKKEIDFAKMEKMVVFKGKNGIGKTNILEAVYALSIGKSFRTNDVFDMIKWESDFSRIKGEIFDDENTSLEVFYSSFPKKMKNFKKNSVSISHKNFFANLLTVLFHPEDLNMLYLSPSYRRKYLDLILSQTDKHYLSALMNFNKALKQRNNLLKDLQKKVFEKGLSNLNLSSLEIWDEKFIEFASEILEKRQKFTLFLENLLAENYTQISGGNEQIQIKYFCKNQNITPQNVAEILRLELLSRRQKDIYSGKTTFGPHLDDLLFYIDQRVILKSASRGEVRSLLLALKLSEISYISHKRKNLPVLLLDDVLSELDFDRQKHFLTSIKDCQVFITGTDLENPDLKNMDLSVLDVE